MTASPRFLGLPDRLADLQGGRELGFGLRAAEHLAEDLALVGWLAVDDDAAGVADQGGGVLPGTTVSATARATGVVRVVITNEEGLYSITALNPGIYDVKADIPGFTPSIRQQVTLVTGTTLTLDFVLGVAAQSERVVVLRELHRGQ